MVMVSFHLNRIVTKTVGKELQAAAHTESAVKMQDLWRLSLGAPANSSPKCCSLGESPWNAFWLHLHKAVQEKLRDKMQLWYARFVFKRWGLEQVIGLWHCLQKGYSSSCGSLVSSRSELLWNCYDLLCNSELGIPGSLVSCLAML